MLNLKRQNLILTSIVVMTSWLLEGSVVAKKTGWSELRTDSFTIISNAQPKRIESLWKDLHYFEVVVEKAFPEFLSDQEARKHLIVMPKSGQEYEYLAPLQKNGKSARSAGVYLANEFNPIILVRNDPLLSANRRIVFHEYSHRLTHAILGRLPTWADEGIAELFASFKLRRQNLVAGRIEKDSIMQTLNSEGFIPFEAFFSQNRNHLRKRKALNVSYPVSFYAQARLLAHYAYFSDEGKRWPSYLRLAKIGIERPIDESDVSFHMQMNYEELERALEDYIERGGHKSISISIAELDELPRPETTALAENDLHAYFAMILTRGNHYARAEEYFQKTRETGIESSIWLSGRSEYMLYQSGLRKAGDLAWKANLLHTEDPFISTLAVMHASTGRLEEINSYEKDDANRLLDMLKLANSQGDSTRYLFETYHGILIASGSEISKEHSDFLYQGIDLYPNISYSISLLKIITDRIFDSN